MPIDYIPVTSRILKEQGVPLPREAYVGPYMQEAVGGLLSTVPPPSGTPPTTPLTTKG
jgi:hypothetical protein